MNIGRHETQITREKEQRIEFTRRSMRDVEKPLQLRIAVAPATFGNVSGY